jgi:hypothetical protein
MSKPPPITPADLQKAVNDSGFPFQFQVVDSLAQRGYEVSPSHCIYDPQRQASCEMDLAAIKRTVYDRAVGSFTVNLNLVIECKDTKIPFVSFGLKHQSNVRPAYVDEDIRFLHITTTRDKSVGYFGLAALDSKGTLKPEHHQLTRPDRFYSLTTADWVTKTKHWKLHVTENVSNMLSKFAAMTDHFDHQWDGLPDKPELERLSGGPILGVLFLMIVHSGEQYELLAGSKTPVQSNHTPVMASYGMPHGNLAFVVDVVPFSHLPEALDKVEKTCMETARQLEGIFLRTQPVRLAQKDAPVIPERF